MDATIMTVFATIISILFAGNIYFIKKLVEKIDLTATTAGTAMTKIESVQTTVSSVSNQLREIKTEIKELRHVEIEVAVLKAQLGVKVPNGV